MQLGKINFTFSCSWGEPKAAQFKTLTTWNNVKGSEWVIGGAIQFIDFKSFNDEDGMDLKTIDTQRSNMEDGSNALVQNFVVKGSKNVAMVRDK